VLGRGRARSIRSVNVTSGRRRALTGPAERRGPGPLLFGAALALNLAAAGPPAPAPPVDRAAHPALWAYPATANVRTTPFVGFIGDSTATQLIQPMAVRLRPRGAGVVKASMSGCQATDAVLTYASTEYYKRHRACPAIARRLQREMTARFRPKVVIWSDAMEWSDIKVNRTIVRAGGAPWRRLMLAAWDRTLGRLGPAALVLILPTWWAGFPAAAPSGFPVGRQRALFLEWAARHPGRVTPVDLAPVICPTGPPCRQVMGGVRLRRDYLHYSPAGLRKVISKIVADAAVLQGVRGPGRG
jgi:hypothetical protein